MFPSAAIVEGGDLYRRCQGRHLALGIVGLNPFRSWFQGGSRQPGVGLTAQSVGQVRSHLIHPSVCVGDPDPVLRCIVSGFFANAARFHSTGAYRTIRDDHELHIHPASVLYAEKPPRWVIYNEVIQTSKYYMRDVTAIESAWLLELAPHFYQQGTHLSLKAKRAKVQDQ